MNKLETFIRRICRNNTAIKITKLNHELFASLLVFYLLLLLIDNIWKDSISPYINQNNLLIITLASGVVAILPIAAIKIYESKSAARRIYENKTIRNIIKLNHELFSTLLITYLILFLVDNIWETSVFWETSVSAHFNLNYLLIVTVLSGMISVLTTREEDIPESESTKTTTMEYILILVEGLIGAVIICYKTQDLGKISYIISIISGLLIVMLSIIVLDDNDSDNNNTNDMY